jgi:Kre9/KNH-like N-terminal Ig-like domain
MGIRRVFSILLGIFLIGFIGCRGAEFRRDEIPCKAASAIPASTTVNGKITIAWDLNTDDKTVRYRIYYGLSSQKYMECVDIGSPVESSPGTVKYTLIDLEKGKRYYIAVIAYDKNNNKSVFSSEVSAVAE